MNRKTNVIKYAKMVSMILFVLLVTVITQNLVIATTNPVAGQNGQTVQLTRTNYPGGEEATGFFTKNADRQSVYNGYDKRQKYGFRTGENPAIVARKIAKAGGNASDILYCLDERLDFPNDSGINYRNIGELKNLSAIPSKSGDIQISQEKKNKIYWFAENLLYERSDKDAAYKADLKEKIFKGAYLKLNRVTENQVDPVHLETGLRRYMKTITDDEMSLINQWVIWNIITGNNNFERDNTFDVLTPGNSSEPLNQDTKNARKEVYQYLISEIEKNKGVAPQREQIKETFITATGEGTLKKLGSGYSIEYLKFDIPEAIKNKIGEIKLYRTKTGGTDKVEIPLYDVDVFLKGAERSTRIDKLNDLIGKGEFKLQILNDFPEGYNEIMFEVADSVVNTKLTVYVPESGAYQPVVGVEREVINYVRKNRIPVGQKPVEKKYDLALRKFIMSIDGQAPAIDRTPKIDNNKLADFKYSSTSNGTETTRTYLHPKNPLDVNIGSTVRYGISVYNEFENDAKVDKVIDVLPPHLELKENSSINAQYGWKKSATNPRAIESEIAKDRVLQGVKATNENGGTRLQFDKFTFQVELVVTDQARDGEILTNIAYINNQTGLPDRDSVPGNTSIPGTMDTYKGNGSNKSELEDSNYFYKGQEDDDDFEKVRVRVKKEFDLALRKFITDISGQAPNPSREPVVDVTPLKTGKTTATYTHPKNELLVQKGDVVTYKLRIYNEAGIHGIVDRIDDYLPSGMGFLPEHKINKQYGWKVSTLAQGETKKASEIAGLTVNANKDKFDGVTDLANTTIVRTSGAQVRLETNNLKANLTEQEMKDLIERGQIKESERSKIWMPFDGKSNTLDYKDVEIALIVLADAKNQNNLKNIAEIGEDYPANITIIKDRDSTPGNVRTPGYGEKSQEDDDDFEPLYTRKKEFDLALRKFITEIAGKAPAVSREPKVDVSPLRNGQTTATYTHPKNALLVQKGDIVKYKLRVYNEAEIPGIINEIADYLPSGLGYLPEHKLNKENGWKVSTKATNTVKEQKASEITGFDIKANLSEFDGVSDAKNIKIVRPSETNKEGTLITTEKYKTTMTDAEITQMISTGVIPDAHKDKVLKPFTSTSTTLDYREVEIAAVVLADVRDGNNLKNISEIQRDYPANITIVKDRDSTPGNVRVPGYGEKNQEDDDDFEPLDTVKKEFDLSLRKFITKISSEDGKDSKTYERAPVVDVTPLKNGKTTATYTHPKDPLLVLPKNIVDYTLRIFNEGDIDRICKRSKR